MRVFEKLIDSSLGPLPILSLILGMCLFSTDSFGIVKYGSIPYNGTPSGNWVTVPNTVCPAPEADVTISVPTPPLCGERKYFRKCVRYDEDTPYPNKILPRTIEIHGDYGSSYYCADPNPEIVTLSILPQPQVDYEFFRIESNNKLPADVVVTALFSECQTYYWDGPPCPWDTTPWSDTTGDCGRRTVTCPASEPDIGCEVPEPPSFKGCPWTYNWACAPGNCGAPLNRTCTAGNAADCCTSTSISSCCTPYSAAYCADAAVYPVSRNCSPAYFPSPHVSTSPTSWCVGDSVTINVWNSNDVGVNSSCDGYAAGAGNFYLGSCDSYSGSTVGGNPGLFSIFMTNACGSTYASGYSSWTGPADACTDPDQQRVQGASF